MPRTTITIGWYVLVVAAPAVSLRLLTLGQFEQVPKLLYARELLQTTAEATLVLPQPPALLSRLQTDTLALLGLGDIDPSRVFHYNKSTTVRADKLVVYDWRPTDGSLRTEFLPPADALRTARSALVSAALGEAGESSGSRSRIVWVSRNEGLNKGRRSVDNEAEVIERLQAVAAGRRMTLYVFHGAPSCRWFA